MSDTDARIAFETAIAARVLSASEGADNYAGEFMYMGDTASGCHLFKHRLTREYLAPVPPAIEED